VTAAEGGSRSQRKHAAIVTAATSVFLDRGYHGASMDEVARVAAVSKQTVYKHFAGKKMLFEQVMLATSEPMHTALRDAVDGVTGSGTSRRTCARTAGRCCGRRSPRPWSGCGTSSSPRLTGSRTWPRAGTGRARAGPWTTSPTGSRR
jgi:AcrR family transcriptional regulator